jgi:hypothetical protein
VLKRITKCAVFLAGMLHVHLEREGENKAAKWFFFVVACAQNNINAMQPTIA